MFNLQKHERVIIILLISAFLIGLSISAYQKSHSGVKINIESYTVNNEVRKISINAAGADELSTVNGIGKALAERIVKYRSANGLFLYAEDIKKVKGIGPKLFEKIKDRISVE